MSDRSRKRLRTIITILATALIIAPAAALATHGFNDVDNSDFFHAAVDWMKDNGVTVGCNPPHNTRYCPHDPVTRGEMAVFLERLDTKNVFLRPGEVDLDGGDADTLDGKHASAFLGVNAKASDADTVDGIDGGDLHQGDIEIAYNTHNAVVRDDSVDDGTTIEHSVSHIEVQPGATDAQYVLLPMERPLGDAGDPDRFIRLTALTVCYLVDDAADAITDVGVAYPVDTGPTYVFLPLSESVSWSSTSATCEDVPVPTDGVSLPRPATLQLGYLATAATDAHSLRLLEVRATWGPA